MPAPKEGSVGHEVEDEVEADAIVTPHNPLFIYRFTAGTVWVAY
jgi:hypothetical protein